MSATGTLVFQEMGIVPDGSGSTFPAPDGQGGTITADKEGNRKYFEFWQSAADEQNKKIKQFEEKNAKKVEAGEKPAANPHAAPYDASIFTKKLTEEDLKKNESFLKAAKIIYDMEHKPGAWDERVVTKGWGEAKAKKELGSYGINYGSELFFQDWEAINEFWKRKGRSEEQKIALRYLKDSYDHKDWNVSSFARAIYKSMVDPVNLGLIAIGAAAAPITGGASFAAAAGVVAARKAGQTGIKSVMSKTGRSIIWKEVAKDFAAKPARHTAKKTLRGAAINAGLMSAASGGVSENAIQNIEIAGAEALGKEQEYSTVRTAGATIASGLVGAGVGVATTMPIRPTVEAFSDLVFDPIRNTKFFKALAPEKNAENAFENAIKKAGQDAYDETFESVKANTASGRQARKEAEAAQKSKLFRTRLQEARKKKNFEAYLNGLDQNAKDALKDAGNKEYEITYKRVLRETGSAELADKKADIEKRRAEVEALYLRYKGGKEAVKKAGDQAYAQTYRETLRESKKAYEQVKRENGGVSVYDKEPDFETTAKRAAEQEQKKAEKAKKDEIFKSAGAYHNSLREAKLQKLDDELLDIARKSPAAKNYSIRKSFLGQKQDPPPIEMTERTVDFVSHFTKSYYRHISAIFGKGAGSGESLVKNAKGIANEFGDIANKIRSKTLSRSEAENKILEIKTKHETNKTAIENNLNDLKSKLEEVENRLDKVRTRDAFTGELDNTRWIPLKSVADIVKLRPYQIPKYMPYWPGENIRVKEKQALIEFKTLLKGQIEEVEKVYKDEAVYVDKALKRLDKAISNKNSSDHTLARSLDYASSAIDRQAVRFRHRVTDGDPLTYTGEEASKPLKLTFKDRMFLTVEEKNVDYAEWLIRSIRDTYVNPYQRATPIARPKDVYQNAEKLSWQIEKFWSGRTNVKSHDSEVLAGHIHNLYRIGMEQEALYAVRHLGYAFGRNAKIHNVKDLSQNNYLPAALVAEVEKLHRSDLHAKGIAPEQDKHFNYFMEALKTTQEKAMGGHHPGPMLQGGQRAIEKFYNDLTFWPRYSFRHRGAGLFAVPGSEHYFMEPLRGAVGRQFGLFDKDVWLYHLGKPLDKEKTRASMDSEGFLYKNVLKDDWGSKWMIPFRVALRPIIDFGAPIWKVEKIISLGALSKPGVAFAGSAGVLWGAGSALEAALDTDLPDVSADMLNAQLTVIDNTGLKLARGAVGAVGWMSGYEEAAQGVQNYLDMDKNNIVRNFINTKIGNKDPDEYKEGQAHYPEEIARKMVYRLSKDEKTGQQDPNHELYITPDHPEYESTINTIVKEKVTTEQRASEIVRTARELQRKRELAAQQQQQATPPPAAGQQQQQAAPPPAAGQQQQQQAAPPPAAGQQQQQQAAPPPAAGQQQQQPSLTQPFQQSTAAPPSPPAPISQRSLSESWDNLSTLPGRALKAAYTFDGDVPRDLEDVLNVGGNFLSGAASMVGGLASDLYNEKIEGGRWWIGAGAGVAGALMLGSWVRTLPYIGKIPLIGIAAFLLGVPLIARFTKALMDGDLTRQGGSNNYAPVVTGAVGASSIAPGPTPAAVSSVSHSGGPAVRHTLWEDPNNAHPLLSKIEAVDPDGPGPQKFAVQVHGDNGSTYADVEVLQAWSGQGRAPVFISNEQLAGIGLSREDFEYEAITHKDANTGQDEKFINLNFTDRAALMMQNIFIGAPENYVPQ